MPDMFTNFPFIYRKLGQGNVTMRMSKNVQESPK